MVNMTSNITHYDYLRKVKLLHYRYMNNVANWRKVSTKSLKMSKMENIVEKNKSGNYNLGQMFLDVIRGKPPGGICQINADTGNQETYSSVLSRSVKLARALMSMGLKPGDVLALAGKVHDDILIPYYAALLTGLPVLGVDPLFKYDEIKDLLEIGKPKIIFCQQDSYNYFAKASEKLGLDVTIITFDGEHTTMKDLINNCDNDICDDFQMPQFDSNKVYAWLVSTSGTTGVAKVLAISHQVLLQNFIEHHSLKKDRETRPMLSLSPVQWISFYFSGLTVLFTDKPILMTSQNQDTGHIIDVIHKYRPSSYNGGPALIINILKHEKQCDLSCFNFIRLVGSKIYKETILELKARLPPTSVVIEGYGQSESISSAIRPNPAGPLGSCGVPNPLFQIKLVDPETGKEITAPNVTGELWTKGPRFSEYYNNPEATAAAFSEDGYYKTGDLLYRDENDNYFFVDRLKMLIKYRNFHVMPPQLEEVIASHSGVKEVVVTAVPHSEDGQWPVACVVRAGPVTAQEIKDLVASNLSDNKRLRGGVVFLKELPKTSTGKVARAKLSQMVLDYTRE